MAKRRIPKQVVEEQNAAREAAEAEFFLERENLEEEIGSKTETWVNENATKVLGLAGIILLITALYYLVTSVYMPNQEKAAISEMYVAQEHFAVDSFKLALSSPDGSYLGFLDVIDNYSGWSKASNLSHYYAGVSYLNMGEYEKAIEYLSKFKGDDKIFSAMAKGCIGDANSELGRMDEALSNYKSAAAINANDFTSPMYLMKAGQLHEKQGQFKEALAVYESIKKNFPKSQEATTIDKYISRSAAAI